MACSSVGVTLAEASHVTSVVVVAYAPVGVFLAVAGHDTTAVVVALYPVRASLAVAGHDSAAVVVTCDTVCSASAESSAHLFLLSLSPLSFVVSLV